jgi:hypothetical protein
MRNRWKQKLSVMMEGIVEGCCYGNWSRMRALWIVVNNVTWPPRISYWLVTTGMIFYLYRILLNKHVIYPSWRLESPQPLKQHKNSKQFPVNTHALMSVCQRRLLPPTSA